MLFEVLEHLIIIQSIMFLQLLAQSLKQLKDATPKNRTLKGTLTITKVW